MNQRPRALLLLRTSTMGRRRMKQWNQDCGVVYNLYYFFGYTSFNYTVFQQNPLVILSKQCLMFTTLCASLLIRDNLSTQPVNFLKV